MDNESSNEGGPENRMTGDLDRSPEISDCIYITEPESSSSDTGREDAYTDAEEEIHCEQDLPDRPSAISDNAATSNPNSRRGTLHNQGAGSVASSATPVNHQHLGSRSVPTNIAVLRIATSNEGRSSQNLEDALDNYKRFDDLKVQMNSATRKS